MTALVGGTVVATDGAPSIANATVLISGDRIVQVGPADSIALPAGTKTIAMNGKWLIPGLMNMHVHLGLKLPGAAGDSLVNETDTRGGPEDGRQRAAFPALRGDHRAAGGRGPWNGLRTASRHRARRSDRAAHQDRGRSHRPHGRTRFAGGGRPLRVGARRPRADQTRRRLDQDRHLRRDLGSAGGHLGRANDR